MSSSQAVESFVPTKGSPLPYIAGLDGLRAFAVIAVLIYHAETNWLPGGFLGVELFFVISGFLITSGLLSEWRERGHIDLGRFWFRRARRLLPAVAVLLVATLAVSAAFLPEELAGLRADALASLGYVTNWYLIFDKQGYFESAGRPSLLKHLWSLAVEEQFYIVWPALLAVGLRWLKPVGTLGVVLLLSGGSIALMSVLYHHGSDASRLYYGTDTRASGLLIGAALAFVWKPWALTEARRLVRWGLDVIGIATVLALGSLFLHLDEFDGRLYTGGLGLVALLSATAIAVASHPGTQAGRLLNLRPLRWIGVRSYSLYLWHWPVFALTRPQLDVQFDGVSLLLLRFGLTLLLACLSYELVEKPARSGAIGRAWQALRRIEAQPTWRRTVALTGATTALALFVSLGVATATARTPALPDYLSAAPISGILRPEPQQPASEPPVQPLTPVEDPNGVASVLVPPGEANAGPEPASPLVPPLEAIPSPASPASPPAESALDVPAPVEAPPPPVPPAPIDVPSYDGPPLDVRLTAVGDSVLLGAAPQLARTIGAIDVDAAVSRQVGGVIPVLRERQWAGNLSDTVLLHIGNNGTFTARDFDTIMSILEGHRVLVLNLHVPRSWESSNNAVIAEGVSRWPNAVLVDWHGLTADHPELFASDGIHLRPEGARIYADLIASCLQ